MLIDFHTHVFPDKIAERTISALANNSSNRPFSDGTIDGLLSSMQKANADIAVSLPVLTKPTQFDSVAQFAISINERFANLHKKIISFAGIHPDCEDVEGKLLYLKNKGIKGVKIHPDYQETFIDDPKYIRILNIAKELDLIVVTHSGVDDGYNGKPVRCPVDRVKRVVEQVRHKKFVLAHYGAHKQWQNVLENLCGLDVYFDTAFTMHEIDEELFKLVLNKHGADKILFATDSPWRDIKTDFEIIKSFNLGAEIEDKIFYKNALNLLEI